MAAAMQTGACMARLLEHINRCACVGGCRSRPYDRRVPFDGHALSPLVPDCTHHPSPGWTRDSQHIHKRRHCTQGHTSNAYAQGAYQQCSFWNRRHACRTAGAGTQGATTHNGAVNKTFCLVMALSVLGASTGSGAVCSSSNPIAGHTEQIAARVTWGQQHTNKAEACTPQRHR